MPQHDLAWRRLLAGASGLRRLPDAGPTREYALADGALLPSYSGVRPKIHGPGEPAPDFRIDGPAQHGVAGLVNLFGIESPGLTSAMAVASAVWLMLRLR